MARDAYKALLLFTLGGLTGVTGCSKEPETSANYELCSDTVQRALDEGRLAISDLDGDSKRELIYFPPKGPPAIFSEEISGYAKSSTLNELLYQATAKFSAVLTNDSTDKQKLEQLANLEKEVNTGIRPLVIYTTLQDPSLALKYQDSLLPASAATPLLEEICQAKSVADLVLNPKAAAAASLVLVGTRLLQHMSVVYTAPPSYARWTKSGPGWENVGRVENGMVEVTPGTKVNITDTATLKAYKNLLDNPNVIWTSGGLVQLEVPVGMTRQEYYKMTERRVAADAQRRQFEQSVQQAYQRWSTQAQQWNQQAGEQAKRWQQDLNQHLGDWNKQVEQIFKKK